jgi:hypothetical protein
MSRSEEDEDPPGEEDPSEEAMRERRGAKECSGKNGSE